MSSSLPSTTRRSPPRASQAVPAGQAGAGCIDGVLAAARRRAARGVRGLALVAVFALAMAGAVPATHGAEVDDGTVLEYQLKAAFLYNFAKFVQWPAELGGDALTSFTLCVSGELPFRIVQQYLAGKRIRGQSVAVRAVDSPAAAEGCQLLFVSAMALPMQHALTQIGGPVLTVGESGDFLRSGGMINLVRTDNRLRFEISRSAGERAGLRFSSQLLKLATLVADSQTGS